MKEHELQVKDTFVKEYTGYNAIDFLVSMYSKTYDDIPNITTLAIRRNIKKDENVFIGCEVIEKFLNGKNISFKKYTNLTIDKGSTNDLELDDVQSSIVDIIDDYAQDLPIEVTVTNPRNPINQTSIYVTHLSGHKLFVSCNDSSTHFSLAFDQLEVTLVEELIKELSELNEEPEFSAKIHLIEQTQYGFDFQEMGIKKIDNFNVEKLYNDDFKEISGNIYDFLSSKGSGLVILHGVQGTGKTSFLRYLINNIGKKFIFLPVELASALSDPGFIKFIKTRAKNAIVILEDCETLLKKRSELNHVNNGLVNILNISDGLLGDDLEIKFVCTFNSPMDSIDEALKRKGRLKELYEFRELAVEKTNILLKETFGKDFNNDKCLTLADIFNYQEENHGNNKPKKIGFGT